MNLAGAGIDQEWKSINIGAKQLFQSSLFQYFFNDRVFRADLLQFLLTGFVLSCLGLFRLLHNHQLVEQDLPYLFGRIDIELYTGHIGDLLFNPLQFGGVLGGKILQGFQVEPNPAPFHIGQYIYEGTFDLMEQLLQLVFPYFPFQYIF